MAVRTTDPAVRLLNSDTDLLADLSPFIETASFLVDRVCATAVLSDGVTPYYTSTELELIERWLSAHMYCVNAPKSAREKISRLAVENQSKVDLGLDVTHYGQQAMRLDVRGGLAAMNNAAKTRTASITPGVKWAGTKFTE